MLLAGIAALVEKVLLFIGHDAPQDGVSVGKPPEAPDNAAMPLGMGNVRLAETADKRRRPLLIGQLFRMCEGEIEKARQLRLYRMIVSGIDGDGCNSRAMASVAYIRGVPRNALRGN